MKQNIEVLLGNTIADTIVAFKVSTALFVQIALRMSFVILTMLLAT